jgi:hypothetical protein
LNGRRSTLFRQGAWQGQVRRADYGYGYGRGQYGMQIMVMVMAGASTACRLWLWISVVGKTNIVMNSITTIWMRYLLLRRALAEYNRSCLLILRMGVACGSCSLHCKLWSLASSPQPPRKTSNCLQRTWPGNSGSLSRSSALEHLHPHKGWLTADC